MKILRKILNHGKYGQLNLPKAIYDNWTTKGFSHIEMLFDERNNTLIICPV
jgi:hypothetical protein